VKIQRLKRIQTASADLEAVQRNVSDALDQVGECPLVRGQAISGNLYLAAPTPVPHKLGRIPEGYLQGKTTSVGAPVITWVSWNEKTITLATTADCQVDLWVF
jgi:hypothetical protein